MTELPDQPTPIFDYESIAALPVLTGDRFLADRLLLMWVILSALVLPFALLVAWAGVTHPIDEADSMLRTAEDKTAYVLFLLNIPGFLAPFLWIVQCERYRCKLRQKNPYAAAAARRLCTRALFLGALFTLALLFGLLKALRHARWPEIPGWGGMLALNAGWTIAVLYTRRILQRVQQELELAAPPVSAQR